MPARLCSVPRCGRLIPEGHRYIDGCAQCKEREQRDKPWGRKRQRLSFYSTAKWQKLLKVKLYANPICEYCGEVLAVEVDHVIPATAQRSELWYDWDNLKSTCGPCHRQKTATGSAGAKLSG